MAISEQQNPLEHQIFIQGDARDPLGIWVVRHGVTGDDSGGTIKVGFEIDPAQSGGRLYTCYAITIAGIALSTDATAKVRLLTNFPDADRLPDIQGFGTVLVRDNGFNSENTLTAPIGGSPVQLIAPQERFILLFGPQSVGESPVNIVELEINENVDGATYSFEGYGYFWDRQVTRVPGGPRHPGSN